MPIGNCKLCLMQKDLQDSHLLPAAMYKYIRVPLKRNPNPVIVGRKVTATSSRQVTDYLLCAECEELFNKNGEGETLRWVWNGKTFLSEIPSCRCPPTLHVQGVSCILRDGCRHRYH